MLGRDVLISWVRNIPWSSQKTKDFRREIIWDFFAIFCQASRYRTRFQASSGNSDSANWPGYEAERHPFRAGPPCIGTIIGSTLGSFWVAGFLVNFMLGLFLIIPLPWSKKSWVKWPSQYSHWEENYPVLILETVSHSKATDILVLSVMLTGELFPIENVDWWSIAFIERGWVKLYSLIKIIRHIKKELISWRG